MTALGERLYLEYHSKVSAYVRGKISDPHEAEDVVSAIFVKAMERLHTYDENRASLSTWIYTITRSAVADYYRARKLHGEYMDYMDAVPDIPAEEDDSEVLLARLAEGLVALRENERDVIILHYHKGLTLKRAAELLGMSYINAKVLHKKALNRLREHLEKCKI